MNNDNTGEKFVVNLLKQNHIGLATGMFSKPRYDHKNKLVLVNTALLKPNRDKDCSRWILEALAHPAQGRFLKVGNIDYAYLTDHHDWNPRGIRFHKFRVMVINRNTDHLSYMDLSPKQITSVLPDPRCMDTLRAWIAQCKQSHRLTHETVYKRTSREFKTKGYSELMSYPMFLAVIGLEEQFINVILDEYYTV